MHAKVWLSNFYFLPGERRLDYRDAQNFTAVRAQNSLPDSPELFGWGAFYQTTRSHRDMAIMALQGTLRRAELPPERVDYVIFCSTGFHDGDIYQGIDYQQILHKLNLVNAYPFGITLGGCTMLLGALRIAEGLVAGSDKHVLIVSVDKVREEAFRFQNYAVFSDGAVSCLVSGTARSGFEIIGHNFASQYHPNVATPDDSALYKQNHQRLLQNIGLTTSDFKKVFTNNLFYPIVTIKEGLTGVSAGQLYRKNTPLIGHCYSADTLINLATYSQEEAVRPGELFLLNAVSVTGQRGQIVVRACQIN
ncbi:hypothetical protein KKJ06_12840 [Xenorhabdus bovienii]|uniref:hypothetical protein n=1 Tax=Xenorhabdus bovienii TaxID=40576 RepID=UPI0023B26A0C|nr:hypothetical protein [Xenorhabdus bovienii]MDE9482417.1 hypothetical protein [Xenorhabdus bovienii]MDE9556293.1 hypothetical protein [Xenorhabdus bovienii]